MKTTHFTLILCLAWLVLPLPTRAESEEARGCQSEQGAGCETGEEKAGADTLTLPPANLEHVSIKTEEVRLGSLEKTLKVPGRVSANLNMTAVVTSTLEGRLKKLNVDLNDPVRSGDVLGLVESPELFGKAIELKAPIGGMITDRKRTVGELVNKDSEIYVISDPSLLWVIAEIRERDLRLVHVGQEAAFRVLSYPDRKFVGKVVRLGSEVEMKSRTVEARVEAPNVDGLLKAGMFADVEVVTTVLANAPLISDAALQTEGDSQVVFVALGENRFQKRPVKLGQEQDGVVQVLSGLQVGERVVTDGSFILKSEMLKGELGEE